jgi:hypothetical protein
VMATDVRLARLRQAQKVAARKLSDHRATCRVCGAADAFDCGAYCTMGAPLLFDAQTASGALRDYLAGPVPVAVEAPTLLDLLDVS